MEEEEEEEGLMREVSGLKDGCIIGLSPRPPTTCALIIFMIMITFMVIFMILIIFMTMKTCMATLLDRAPVHNLCYKQPPILTISNCILNIIYYQLDIEQNIIVNL